MGSVDVEAEKVECSVNGFAGQEGDRAVATEDGTAQGGIVLKWERLELSDLLCGGNR